MALRDIYSKLSDQEKKILYVTLGVIVFAVFDFLFLQPVFSKLKSLDRDIAQTKGDIKRDVRYLSYREKILKENEIYSVYQADEQKSEEEIIAGFLKTIENLGREAEVIVGKLTPAETIPKKGYVQYFANVECNGKLENIVKFVHKIDTTQNLLKVVKMNMIGKKASADEVTVTMKISKLIIDTQAVEGESGLDPSQLDVKASDSQGPASMSGAPTSAGGAKLGQQGSAQVSGAQGSGIGRSGSGGSAQGGSSEANGKSGGNGSEGVGGEAEVGGTSGVGGGESGNEGTSGASGEEAGGGGVGQGGGGGGEPRGGGVSGGGSGESDGGGGGGGGKPRGGGTSGGGSGKSVGGGGVSGGGTQGQSGGGEVGSGSGGEGGQEVSGADGGDMSTANGGATGSQSGSSESGEEGKSVKDRSKSKETIPLDDVVSGERMQVTGIEKLWNDFWGIKPKAKPGPRDRNADDYKSADEVNPNLWERLLDKK